MIFDALSLIFLGFIVGLSGAMIPGPLLAFTIFDTSRKGRVTGHRIIAGHAFWELGIILLILGGLGWIVIQHKPIIYMLGGLVLVWMGVGMIRSKSGEMGLKRSRVDSSLLGGLFYTAFNPTQPPWWATAGLALLLKGVELMGAVGVVLVTLGHWLSDLVYYTFVSYLVHKHRRCVNPHQRVISIILGVFMVLLGIYFLTQGLQSFF